MNKEENPITQVDPVSLDRLMQEDRLNLTQADIRMIVAACRAQREEWSRKETTASNQGKKRPSLKNPLVVTREIRETAKVLQPAAPSPSPSPKLTIADLLGEAKP